MIKSSDMVRFGELLRGYRLEAELTQSDLARLAGIGLETVGALERGINHRPRKSTVERLAIALSLDEGARAQFEAYARPKPRPRGREQAGFAARLANCPTCRFDCASAPEPWGDLLATICRQRRLGGR